MSEKGKQSQVPKDWSQMVAAISQPAATDKKPSHSGAANTPEPAGHNRSAKAFPPVPCEPTAAQADPLADSPSPPANHEVLDLDRNMEALTLNLALSHRLQRALAHNRVARAGNRASTSRGPSSTLPAAPLRLSYPEAGYFPEPAPAQDPTPFPPICQSSSRDPIVYFPDNPTGSLAHMARAFPDTRTKMFESINLLATPEEMAADPELANYEVPASTEVCREYEWDILEDLVIPPAQMLPRQNTTSRPDRVPTRVLDGESAADEDGGGPWLEWVIERGVRMGLDVGFTLGEVGLVLADVGASLGEAGTQFGADVGRGAHMVRDWWEARRQRPGG